MIIEMIVYLLGSPPVGYEWLQYLFAGSVSIMLLKAFIMLFQYAFKLIDKSR